MCGFVCVEECLEGLGVFVRVIRCVCVHACVRAGRMEEERCAEKLWVLGHQVSFKKVRVHECVGWCAEDQVSGNCGCVCLRFRKVSMRGAR